MSMNKSVLDTSPFTPTLRSEPLTPTLRSSPPATVTMEQQYYIKEILDICCSDSRFAEKAYIAISRVLQGGVVIPATVTSLTPSSTVIGSPSFDLHVLGTGFTPTSVITFNGLDEPTTFISASEVSTGVNMDVWLAPAVVPVAVQTDGVTSESMNFTFTGAQVLSTPTKSSQIHESVGPSGEQKPSKDSGR